MYTGIRTEWSPVYITQYVCTGTADRVVGVNGCDMNGYFICFLDTDFFSKT